MAESSISDSFEDLFDFDWIREELEGLLIGMDQSACGPALDLFQLRAGPEHDRIFGDFARTRVDDKLIRNETLVDLFRQTARDHAARTAIECGGESLSYRELDRRAEVMADRLRELGVKPGALVGLYVERSCAAYVAMLGILKAGGAYVPLDPGYPADRVEYILRDSAASLLVCGRQLGAKLGELSCPTLELDGIAWSTSPRGLPAEPARSGDLAYVIYTSGSTGRPKGVMIEHRSICHFIRSEAKDFRPTPEDRVYQGFSLAFDASLEEIWLAFFSGATLVAATSAEAFAASELSRFLNRHRVTIFSTVPTILSFITEELNSVRLLILGGEAAPRGLVEKWVAPGRRLINTYGPTEATVVTTFSECGGEGCVTIGRGLTNVSTYILDENKRPVGAGCVGELYLGGPCLARGYLAQPELTGEKFVTNPFAEVGDMEKRLYRTGDLARFTLDGSIEFMGRVDAQVKLRGFRVELSEIESVLLACENIKAAAVTVARSPLGLDQLVAFVVCAEGVKFDKKRALEVLKPRLASYMLPSHFEQVADLPRLPSGKLDRKKLPDPNFDLEADSKAQVRRPRLALANVHMERAWDLWRKIFAPVEVTDPDDGFFDLGGHSLMAAKLVSELRKIPDYAHVSVTDVYKYPKLRDFADCLRERSDGAHADAGEPVASASAPAAVMPKALFVLSQIVGVLLISALASLPVLALLSHALALGQRGLSLLHINLLVGAWALLGWPLYFGLAIAFKWLLIGKYRAGEYPVGGFFHLRFWLVNRIEGLLPLNLLIGTPFLNFYLRLMGARVGKNVFIGSQTMRIYDLLRIGDGATIEFETQLLGYHYRDRRLVIGPIELGEGAHVGTKAAVDPDCAMADNAELVSMSYLAQGETIPAGARWSGCPAQPFKGSQETKEWPAAHAGSPVKAAFCGAGQALVILSLPMLVTLPAVLTLELLLSLFGRPGSLEALVRAPLGVVLQIFGFSLEVAAIKWLLLGRVREGVDRVNSFFYFRKWTVETLMQLHLMVCHPLYATLYLIPWMRLLGAKIGKRVEISTATHLSTDMLSIDDESFIADSVCLGAPRVRRGWIQSRQTRIGRRTFVGNSAMVPQGTRLGSNCLVGVLSVSPESALERMKDGTSWLGSPPMELPRRQAGSCFAETSTYSPTKLLVLQRLFIEFFRITLPGTFLVLATYSALGSLFWLQLQVSTPAAWALMPLVSLFCLALFVGLAVGLKWLLIGRFKPGNHPLWSLFIWKNELVTAMHEAFAVPALVHILQGTPLMAWYLRALGCKVGRDTIIETTHFTEFDLVELGDRVSLNSHCTVQTHLFEDRVSKQSTLKIGDDCGLGAMAVVLVDSRMGHGSYLNALSLLMKGEALPPRSEWAGIPIRKVTRPRAGR